MVLTTDEWTGLLAGLASGDFDTREGAQRRLNHVSADQMEEVRRQAERTADLEVKARLLQRAGEMLAWRATHPKPLALHIHDATLDELVMGINRAAGQTILRARPVAEKSPRFTLDADGISFVDLVVLFQSQYETSLDLNVTPLGLRAPGLVPKAVRFRSADSFLIRPQVLMTAPKIDSTLREDPGLQLGTILLPDPRIRVVRYSHTLLLRKAVDDRGTDLTRGVGNGMDPMVDTVIGLPPFVSTMLSAPDRRATTIASASGIVRLEVAVDFQRMVIEDAEKKMRVPVSVGDGEVTITNIDRGNMQRFQAGWSSPAAIALEDPSKAPPVFFCIFDNAGDWCGSYTSRSNGGSGTFRGNPLPGPLRVEIIIPRRTMEIDFPLELNDVPLPLQKVESGLPLREQPPMRTWKVSAGR